MTLGHRKLPQLTKGRFKLPLSELGDEEKFSHHGENAQPKRESIVEVERQTFQKKDQSIPHNLTRHGPIISFEREAALAAPPVVVVSKRTLLSSFALSRELPTTPGARVERTSIDLFP
jgi:hypothetical protein